MSYNARKCCWFWQDEDWEGSACAATARAPSSLPPASLLVRLSSLLEQIAEVLKVIQQRIVEPIADEPVPLSEFVVIGAVPVPQITDDIGEGVLLAPQEHLQNRTQEQITEFPVPPVLEALVDVVRSTPQEHVQNRTPEQTTEFPVRHIMEERMQNRTLDQISEFRVLRIEHQSKLEHANFRKDQYPGDHWILCSGPEEKHIF